jgi:hypothetical protein
MKNFILNGAMRFDQNKEGGAYLSLPNAEVYGLDQWRYCGGTSSNGSFYLIRVPFPNTYDGNKYCMQIGVVTQQEVIGSTDNFHLEHAIEGCNIAPWSFGSPDAKTLTLSFLAMAHVAGDYSVTLMNGINTRSYVTSFNIPTPNIFHRITVTIPGDTEGVWSTDVATFGAKVIWSFGVGLAATAPISEVWNGAAYWNKADTVQLVTNPHNTCLYLSEVQLEIGDSATDFEHLEYTEELQILQRYYFKTFPQGIAVGNAKGLSGAITSSINGALVEFPVTMCGIYPGLIETFNPINNDSNWYNCNLYRSSGAASLFNASDKRVFALNGATETPNTIMAIHMVADARLGGS